MVCDLSHTEANLDNDVLLGSVVFPQADQYVVTGEVLVPGRVEDAVSSSEDPLITDQTGSTQQLLWAALVQHHLPAHTKRFSSNPVTPPITFDMLLLCLFMWLLW